MHGCENSLVKGEEIKVWLVKVFFSKDIFPYLLLPLYVPGRLAGKLLFFKLKMKLINREFFIEISPRLYIMLINLKANFNRT